MPQFGFTTTKRKKRDEVVHGGATSAKFTAALLSGETDNENFALRNLLDDAINVLDLDKANRTDSTLTVSGSFVSGSFVTITVTI